MNILGNIAELCGTRFAMNLYCAMENSSQCATLTMLISFITANPLLLGGNVRYNKSNISDQIIEENVHYNLLLLPNQYINIF